MTHDTQITEFTYCGIQSRGCANPDCSAVLDDGSPAMDDSHRVRVYCVPCGQRLRYHRRKALERGEALPDDHAAVEAIHRAAGVS